VREPRPDTVGARTRVWRVLVAQDSQLAEKLKILSFRGALRAEESLLTWALIYERFLASLGLTKQVTSVQPVGSDFRAS
jgi:hypothetical protein